MAKTQSAATPDAIEMLLEDHKRMQKLFRDFQKADRGDDDALRELVETACMELQIHAMLEEEIFYPAVRSRIDETDDEKQDLLNESEVEHEAADELIAKLHELEPDDVMYSAYFNVLADHVRNHIRNEEKELFPAARQMTGLDLQKLADDMRMRRDELFAEIEAGEDEQEPVENVEEETDVELSDSHLDIDIEEETEDEQEQIDISRTRH